MSNALRKDIGALIKSVHAVDYTALTAGAGGDGAEVTGTEIDRDAQKLPQSCVLAIHFEAVLAQDATLSLTVDFEHDTVSGFGSTADFKNVAAAVVATGGPGGSTEKGVYEVDVPLDLAKQFIRAMVTPDLSAASIDTATITGIFVLDGFAELPQ